MMMAWLAAEAAKFAKARPASRWTSTNGDRKTEMMGFTPPSSAIWGGETGGKQREQRRKSREHSRTFENIREHSKTIEHIRTQSNTIENNRKQRKQRKQSNTIENNRGNISIDWNGGKYRRPLPLRGFRSFPPNSPRHHRPGDSLPCPPTVRVEPTAAQPRTWRSRTCFRRSDSNCKSRPRLPAKFPRPCFASATSKVPTPLPGQFLICFRRSRPTHAGRRRLWQTKVKRSQKKSKEVERSQGSQGSQMKSKKS
jgi:hypothetical protein